MGIHEPQQGFPAGQQGVKACTGLVLQAMQPLCQPQRQQGFALAALADALPTSGCGSPLQALQAQMSREVPVAGRLQGVGAGLLLAVGHQRAVAALGRVVAPGLMGVVNHQQHAGIQACSGLLQPGSLFGVELRGPTGGALEARIEEPQGFELGELFALKRFAGLEPQRGLGLINLVQGHLLAAPEDPVPLHPLHGQGIEHLMGQQHTVDRTGAELSKAQPAAAQGAGIEPGPLPLRHAWVGFDQQQGGASRQLGPTCCQLLGQLQSQIPFSRTCFHERQGLIGGLLQQPLGDLRSQQRGEIRTERRRGGEITARPHLQAATAVGAVLGVMQRPLHVGAKRYGAAGSPQALRQPRGCGMGWSGSRAHGRTLDSGRMLATEAGAMARVMGWFTGAILSLVLLLGLGAGPALAYDNPDLLPDHPTPVIDLAKILTDSQRSALEAELNDFEAVSGWKLRVLTQYDRTPGLAVKDFWGLDERSLLLIADERGGNLLNFNVGDALFALMPRTYWVELQTRFGNVYYVRDHGQDASILDSLHTVKGCLEIGGCQVVPGLPQEQWLLTLATSVIGGLIVGFAAYPRKPEHTVEWAWVLLLSPLWVILFGVFGIAPIITRTPDVLPLLRNALGFVGAIVAAYLIAQNTVGKQRLKDSEG